MAPIPLLQMQCVQVFEIISQQKVQFHGNRNKSFYFTCTVLFDSIDVMEKFWQRALVLQSEFLQCEVEVHFEHASSDGIEASETVLQDIMDVFVLLRISISFFLGRFLVHHSLNFCNQIKIGRILWSCLFCFQKWFNWPGIFLRRFRGFLSRRSFLTLFSDAGSMPSISECSHFRRTFTWENRRALKHLHQILTNPLLLRPQNRLFWTKPEACFSDDFELTWWNRRALCQEIQADCTPQTWEQIHHPIQKEYISSFQMSRIWLAVLIVFWEAVL